MKTDKNSDRDIVRFTCLVDYLWKKKKSRILDWSGYVKEWLECSFKYTVTLRLINLIQKEK